MRVWGRGTLDGDAYEAWVAGYDTTGAAKGGLRTDARGVRFVEVTVNGPKTWSLAAAVHPDIAAVYDRAQDRAAREIVGWLAEHATTRVGPLGRQVQVAVEELEAAVVRHQTSRAGDPHRHLHLQINAGCVTASVVRGDYVDPRAGRITVAEYARTWAAVQVSSAGTARIVDNALRLHLLPQIGARPMAEILPSTIQGFVKNLEANGLSAGTVRNIHDVAWRLFDSAVSDRVIGGSPFVKIRLPTMAKHGGSRPDD